MKYIAKQDDELMVVGFVNDDANVNDDAVVSKDEMVDLLAQMLKNSDIGYLFED